MLPSKKLDWEVGMGLTCTQYPKIIKTIETALSFTDPVAGPLLSGCFSYFTGKVTSNVERDKLITLFKDINNRLDDIDGRIKIYEHQHSECLEFIYDLVSSSLNVSSKMQPHVATILINKLIGKESFEEANACKMWLFRMTELHLLVLDACWNAEPYHLINKKGETLQLSGEGHNFFKFTSEDVTSMENEFFDYIPSKFEHYDPFVIRLISQDLLGMGLLARTPDGILNRDFVLSLSDAGIWFYEWAFKLRK
ncbi:hypothetical protein HB762_08895 [Vibrio campbellii]|uniref:DUF4393 domain-containing protein n=1 Tax=Vibrio campbellii TaxID=680 RepID=A0ABY5IB08_9VIBR|nr:hypothetical protein [Vibrio campbellii]UTZ31510.1 hypothetical protein HB762_08895 [Vibrio campbellii]